MRGLVLLFALGAGCEPGSPAPVSLPPMPLEHVASIADAGLPPGRCPQDAPWNGKVCVGMGYVSCPGQEHFDDAGACTSASSDGPARDAGRDR